MPLGCTRRTTSNKERTRKESSSLKAPAAAAAAAPAVLLLLYWCCFFLATITTLARVVASAAAAAIGPGIRSSGSGCCFLSFSSLSSSPASSLLRTTTAFIVSSAAAARTMTSSSASFSSSDGVDVETDNGRRLHFVWVPEVNSTQDGMKTLLASSVGGREDIDVVALGAASQTKGRGTSGRAWVGLNGNAFLTLPIPTATIAALPYPITLLPLRIGTLVAREIAQVLPTLEAKRQVNLKWPNDVLIGDGKVSGLLIEMDGSARYYLLGIGVNVAHAPPMPTSGTDRGRVATCLAEHGVVVTDLDTAKELSLAISRAITEWVGKANQETAEQVVAEWGDLVLWGKVYKRRDDESLVVPLGLEADGRLRVRDQATGAIRYLVTEYLH